MIIFAGVLAIPIGIFLLKSIEKLLETQTVYKWPLLIVTVGISMFAVDFYGWTIALLFHLIFWYGLILVAWIDYYSLSIVDATVYLLGIWAFAFHFLLNQSVGNQILGALIGFLIYWIIYALSKAFYKKEAFGFGDVMLMGAIGAYLGIRLVVLASFLSFYVALIGILVQKFFGKKLGLKEEVAFGPAICLSAWVTVIFGDELINWYLETFLF